MPLCQVCNARAPATPERPRLVAGLSVRPYTRVGLVRARHSRVDSFTIGGHPPPSAGAVATCAHTFLVDLSDDLAVPGKQRFGRAHLRAQRQLALQQAVCAILLVFLDASGNFWSAAACAIGALVHLAARSEVADHGILRCAERAGVEAIAAADAQILGVEDDTLICRENAAHGTHGRTRRVGAVHACHGNRALAGLSVVEGDNAPAVDPPRR